MANRGYVKDKENSNVPDSTLPGNAFLVDGAPLRHVSVSSGVGTDDGGNNSELDEDLTPMEHGNERNGDNTTNCIGRVPTPQLSPISSSSDSASSPVLNVIHSEEEAKDLEGIALLRQIFPEESTEKLRQMHEERLRMSLFSKRKEYDDDGLPRSALGRRLWNEAALLRQKEERREHSLNGTTSNTGYRERIPLHWKETILPDDFLRLPSHVAIRRKNSDTEHWEYQLVKDLERRCLQQYRQCYPGNFNISSEQYITKVIFREPYLGLGVTLSEEYGCIRIHALVSTDGKHWTEHPPTDSKDYIVGPSLHIGIDPGDILLGINGCAFLETAPLNESLLRHAVHAVQQSPNPVVLHLIKSFIDSPQPDFTDQKYRQQFYAEAQIGLPSEMEPVTLASLQNHTPSLLDTTIDLAEESMTMNQPIDPERPPLPRDAKSLSFQIHPFAHALEERGLITPNNSEAQKAITNKLIQFTERTRQWEATGSFLVDCTTFALLPQKVALNSEKNNKKNSLTVYTSSSLNSFVTNDILMDSASPSTPIFEGQSVANHYHFFASGQQQDDESITPKSGGDDSFDNNLVLPSTRNRVNENDNLKKKESLFAGYPGVLKAAQQMHQQKDNQPLSYFLIPLIGVRKALSVRILNTFLDGNRTAYTIWIYDVESGREWYAPIRYFSDFEDIRSAAMRLCPASVGKIPFPQTHGWSVFGLNRRGDASESESVREAKCRQLEHFLKSLCAMIYTEDLHPSVTEIAVHVQSFLGCEDALCSEVSSGVEFPSRFLGSSSYYSIGGVQHTAKQMSIRLLLKRCIQRYTYRLFLLKEMRDIVDQFVNRARIRGPKLNDIEVLESKGRSFLKKKAMEEIRLIQSFLDQVQELILDGCMDDFRSIVQHGHFSAIHEFVFGNKHGGGVDEDGYWDRLVRDAVREQVEVEVYVPLRSIVSRLLVNGWRHEDMEVQFKIQELKKRPQKFFRIPEEKFSSSDWQSVSSILKQGVSLSTLPCAKLRAIVDAASEITRLHGNELASARTAVSEGEEHSAAATTTNNKLNENNGVSLLGADDFLPIFIFCVARAEMERPCALCLLLRSLCDPINRIGEVGYYLASFEAAITHIQEVDLTEDREEMLSFLSVSLDNE